MEAKSQYLLSLNPSLQKRYLLKITIIGGIDPFSLPTTSFSKDQLPAFTSTFVSYSYSYI